MTSEDFFGDHCLRKPHKRTGRDYFLCCSRWNVKIARALLNHADRWNSFVCQNDLWCIGTSTLVDDFLHSLKLLKASEPLKDFLIISCVFRVTPVLVVKVARSCVIRAPAVLFELIPPSPSVWSVWLSVDFILFNQQLHHFRDLSFEVFNGSPHLILLFLLKNYWNLPESLSTPAPFSLNPRHAGDDHTLSAIDWCWPGILLCQLKLVFPQANTFYCLDRSESVWWCQKCQNPYRTALLQHLCWQKRRTRSWVAWQFLTKQFYKPSCTLSASLEATMILWICSWFTCDFRLIRYSPQWYITARGILSSVSISNVSCSLPCKVRKSSWIASCMITSWCLTSEMHSFWHCMVPTQTRSLPPPAPVTTQTHFLPSQANSWGSTSLLSWCFPGYPCTCVVKIRNEFQSLSQLLGDLRRSPRWRMQEATETGQPKKITWR